jgi:hypothetical protein
MAPKEDRKPRSNTYNKTENRIAIYKNFVVKGCRKF